jgi:prepilin-type N-terminal cleavage/methylation domain-containing protein
MQKARQQGFTLIELSILLVIIGLIVGGVLVGQNLIAAAGVRATISQIEKYTTAVNIFRDKYGGLPGDLNASLASQFGFAARGTFAGEGDGNGVIEGVTSNAAGQNSGMVGNIGETSMFWVDLSHANLIDGSFNTASSTMTAGIVTPTTTHNLDAIIPGKKGGTGRMAWPQAGEKGG